MNNRKTQIRVYTDKQTVTAFENMYPYTMSKFVRNALKLAVEDKQLFQKIFFEEK